MRILWGLGFGILGRQGVVDLGYCLNSLKGGIGDYIGDQCRDYKGGTRIPGV